MLNKKMYLRPQGLRIIALLTAFLLLLGIIASLPLSAAAKSSHSKSKTKNTVIGSRKTKYGKILVVYKHKKKETLYVLKTGTCTGGCLTLWPPVKKSGKLVAKQGVKRNKLKINKKTKQVSYHGHLLYTFKSDTKKHPISGENVSNFFVISTKGKIITKVPSAAPAPSYPGY